MGPLRTPVWLHCVELSRWPPVLHRDALLLKYENWSSSANCAFLVLSLLWAFPTAIRLSLPQSILCYTKLCREKLPFVLLSQVDKLLLITPAPNARYALFPRSYYWTISRKLPTSTSVLPQLDPLENTVHSPQSTFVQPSRLDKFACIFIKSVDVKALDVSCQKHRKRQRLPANPPTHRKRASRSRN